ncbi:hypothetical protein [Streptomyces zhihengii]|uniref:Uncharacterized protein n=1 Tax=Streptomyces zhihengii TaxID=1818004 RepID=A0ABS2UQD9_9ACTN|nr:hypothetical protein [Streptomyces zhihengii]MBM9619675.1 hypothetical protein [Streptomyces zhihengii]
MAIYEPESPPFEMVERSDWGAVAPDPHPPSSWMPVNGGVVIHCLGQDRVAPAAHSGCFTLVRGLQKADMSVAGVEKLPAEPDISHSYLVCVHGVVFEGRGVLVRPFANEPIPGGNMRYYAVCALIGVQDSPTDALIDAMNSLNTYLAGLEGHFAAGAELVPPGSASGSPGDGLRQAVESGSIVLPQRSGEEN